MEVIIFRMEKRDRDKGGGSTATQVYWTKTCKGETPASAGAQVSWAYRLGLDEGGGAVWLAAQQYVIWKEFPAVLTAQAPLWNFPP